ncbi:hypothetical protein LRR81_08835 [Metabacillus sp. GX 13764]|nr:hypothetical protein [Metabacillus kandeliae]MCD7034339.1 hypothetical protein [Metabacillus kandeliae]
MNSIIVYQADNRFFIAVGQGVREIPFAIVNEWRSTGSQVEIREVESYV